MSIHLQNTQNQETGLLEFIITLTSKHSDPNPNT